MCEHGCGDGPALCPVCLDDEYQEWKASVDWGNLSFLKKIWVMLTQ